MKTGSNLVLEHLSKSFNSIMAVNDISLTVKKGELLVLLGPSGSGKSTLLRLIAGLETPDSGMIRFGDLDLVSLPSRQRNIAMVFQNFAVYPHMTVYENIAYPLRVQRLTEPDIRRTIQQVAQRLSIDHLLDRRAATLSGGEAQRVAFGRALVRNAKLLLLDEPFSSLEASLREHLRLEFRSIQRQFELTTIFVTHDQEEAASLANRIALLQGGALQQVDTLDEVVKDPTNRFVASFMSRPILNIFEGRVAYCGKVPFFSLSPSVAPLKLIVLGMGRCLMTRKRLLWEFAPKKYLSQTFQMRGH